MHHRFKHQSQNIFFFQKDQCSQENQWQMTKSEVVLKKADRLASHSLLLLVLNSQKYVQNHSNSHTDLHSHLILNAHVGNPLTQSDQWDNKIHDLWCICIWSGISTRFLHSITFPPMTKELTVHEKIMKYILRNPTQEYLVSDIVSFVWYEAWTRIGDLCRKWLLFKSGEQTRKKWNPFALYMLTDLWKSFKVPE